MTEYIKQNCPLCGTTAEYYWLKMGNSKYYHCSNCAYFIVSKRAEHLLIEAPQHVRDEFAAKPQLAPEGELFVIIVSSPPQAGDAPRAELSGSFLPKSQIGL
ncbi:hypothetical protein IM816_01250 [Luteibacter flocculans]|uniref:Uncharacterized protein n=1 Tax=Luteibacter flocculans TaxID=2780091 RepID=A0ABY4T3U8_9GAMM|nr:hypothetical protein [Luteibacter flocculans]URL58782.1 hypothetical protein IM816_01250 [Luteibacter flocculans]